MEDYNMTHCYECKKGILTKKMVDYSHHGIKLGVFKAEVCSSCGEQFFEASASKLIESAAKKAGVFGLCRTTKVGQSGSGLDIRISKPLAEFVGLSKGTEVMIHPEGKKRLIVEITS